MKEDNFLMYIIKTFPAYLVIIIPCVFIWLHQSGRISDEVTMIFFGMYLSILVVYIFLNYHYEEKKGLSILPTELELDATRTDLTEDELRNLIKFRTFKQVQNDFYIIVPDELVKYLSYPKVDKELRNRIKFNIESGK